MATTLARAFAGSGARISPLVVNGGPGVRVALQCGTVCVVALEVEEGRVTRIYGIGNRAKLAS